MTNIIKRSLKERSKLTKCYYRNGQKKSDYEKLLEKSSDCTKEILEAKNSYILKMTTKLQDPETAKTYWNILSRLLCMKKIPAMPPLLVNGKFVSDFCGKANLFNNFFASICTPIKNSIVLPLFSYRTNARITLFDFTEEGISLIIKNLDAGKAHGCDNISIKMIKTCNESLTVPLRIILEQPVKERRFPEIWKKADVVPGHKKEDKNLLKIYRPISLLTIFSKILERVIYNSLFNHFQSNKLFTSSQSGFLPGNSCIAQLLSIMHEIQTV